MLFTAILVVVNLMSKSIGDTLAGIPAAQYSLLTDGDHERGHLLLPVIKKNE
jgi:hypothetical protein